MTSPGSLHIIVSDEERDSVLTLTMLLRDAGHQVRGIAVPTFCRPSRISIPTSCFSTSPCPSKPYQPNALLALLR
jgi:hypothetical protein